MSNSPINFKEKSKLTKPLWFRWGRFFTTEGEEAAFGRHRKRLGKRPEDHQTANTPLRISERFEQFSPTTFDWVFIGRELSAAKTSNRSRGVSRIVYWAFRALPRLPWLKTHPTFPTHGRI